MHPRLALGTYIQPGILYYLLIFLPIFFPQNEEIDQRRNFTAYLSHSAIYMYTVPMGGGRGRGGEKFFMLVSLCKLKMTGRAEDS